MERNTDPFSALRPVMPSNAISAIMRIGMPTEHAIT